MSDYATKREQAIDACDKVLNGIEDGSVSVSSALLLCKRIARLVNDQDGMQWLEYEYGGYPRGNNGHILSEAWEIAKVHGRVYKDENPEKKGVFSDYMFTELCEELESSIESMKLSLQNYALQGFSVSGEYANLATNNMIRAVTTSTSTTVKNIKLSEKRLGILKSQYYDYAARWQIELQFGKTAKTVFEEYQDRIERYYNTLPSSAIQKLNAIENMMEDGNPEQYAQVLTSCRRLWSETAKSLFEDVLPDFPSNLFQTKSGTKIDISGDHVNNMLSAVIETLQSKSSKNTLVGSQTGYLVDWLEEINRRQNAGVHAEITREEAMQCILHTYIALGDILTLKSMVESENHGIIPPESLKS